MAVEVGCQACPTSDQVYEMACADYESGQVLTSLAGQPQYAYVNLPNDVRGYEASPVDASVEYVAPDESHLRTVRLFTGAWSVDLTQAPAQPEALIISPFSTADVCGNVFRSLEAVRFNRIAEGQGASYEMVCP
jgi:hypothetical protein